MLLSQTICLILLLPLLTKHVAADATADLEALLTYNEDEKEYNEERNKLEAAKDKSDDEKALAVRNFEAYKTQREFLKDIINKILNSGPAVSMDLANSLKMALNDRNDNKQAAIDEAFEKIANAADDSAPNMTVGPGLNPTIPNMGMQDLLKLLESLRLPSADFLTKILSSGGTVLSPSVNQLYTGYHPIPSQHHADNNDKKKVKDLLNTILQKVEHITAMDDDDHFDLFSWFL